MGLEEVQDGLGSGYSQGLGAVVGASSMCQALLHRCNYCMVPAGFNMQTEVNFTFSPVFLRLFSFLDYSLSSHLYIKSQAGLVTFLGPFSL